MTYALEVHNIVKTFGRVRAVDGLSFTVAPGTIFGLLGPNGAGKSTTLKILTTLSRPTSGTASVLGFDVVKRPLEVRRRIAQHVRRAAQRVGEHLKKDAVVAVEKERPRSVGGNAKARHPQHAGEEERTRRACFLYAARCLQRQE